MRGVGNINFDAYADSLFHILEVLDVSSIQRFQQSYTGHVYNFGAAHPGIKIAATEAFYYLNRTASFSVQPQRNLERSSRTGNSLLRSAASNGNRSRAVTRGLSHPGVFLTLCARAKYTNKFRKLPRKRQRLNGEHPKPSRMRGKWTAAEDRPGWRTEYSQAGLRTKGELLCQSVHFSRASGAAPRRTDFDHA
jgi:hypothetical protein